MAPSQLVSDILKPMPSALWCYWISGRKGIRWGAGIVIYLWQGAYLHMAHLKPVSLTVSCSSTSRLVLPFWYQLIQVVSDKGPLNRCCCCCWRCYFWLQRQPATSDVHIAMLNGGFDFQYGMFYTMFHKIGIPLYFCNNFFKCWSIWMKITPLYSLGNLLSGDVVCNCIFYKYSLYRVIQLQLHKMQQKTRIVFIKSGPLCIFCNNILRCRPISIIDIPNWSAENWLGKCDTFTYLTFKYSFKIAGLLRNGTCWTSA